jgi:glycosyltransferase involved in cell wall biosynthesis
VDGLTQKELANLFNQYKYFLTLNPSEGFGLPPLEAMACGCAVIGFDSMGGRDYLVHEKNSFIVDYGRFDQLADYLRKIELDPNIGEGLAKQAVQTASKFTYERFENQWFDYLKKNVYN